VRSRHVNAGKGKRALASELRTKGTDDVKVARRLVSMLARRGYNQSMAFDVVEVALASERERRRV
jgi:regulatory protein